MELTQLVDGLAALNLLTSLARVDIASASLNFVVYG